MLCRYIGFPLVQHACMTHEDRDWLTIMDNKTVSHASSDVYIFMERIVGHVGRRNMAVVG